MMGTCAAHVLQCVLLIWYLPRCHFPHDETKRVDINLYHQGFRI